MPYAESLESTKKLEWLRSLPVGKPRAKIDCFLENTLDYLQQLNNEYVFTRIFRKYPIFGAVSKQIPLCQSFSFYILLVINIILIASYRKYDDDWDNRLENPSLFDYFSTRTTNIIIFVLAALLTVLYLIIFLAFIYKDRKSVV